ncbi:hypothetical protein [Haloactinomyces albus]|uniref:Uncharacterized protein n=1 Tax=Haloactinomyces albus TaxID=1352928 RepID=A0AAE4CKG3_9ACTN|nr:hypothetical protein [Haloactinomyces albus]MDR7300311.1 hypothetical protein [Haloactinomyces albus]
MTSSGQHSNAPASHSAVPAEAPVETNGSDEGRSTERAIEEALARLGNLAELPVSEHVERFDAVHTALTEALGKAENLLSGSSGNGS